MSGLVENPTMQPMDDFYCFAVFDPTTKNLLYSKYNFDFDQFKKRDSSYLNLTNNQLFYKFLLLNETDLWKPFSVKDQLKQYFLPITIEIQQYFDDYNYLLWGFNKLQSTEYVTFNTIMMNEFNLVKYDYFTQVPNLCEFLYIENTGIIYSKYNFDFLQYSKDFNVFGSKISIFYDFLIRLTFLSGNMVRYSGFKEIPNKFKKYFHTSIEEQKNLKEYLENYGIFSIFNDVDQSVVNIDYNKYLFNHTDLTNVIEAKKYFLKYGQFEKDVIEFIVKKDNEYLELSKSVCSIINSNNIIGSGILIEGPSNYNIINNVKQIYIVTCFHIIEKTPRLFFYANCYYNKTQNIRLLFKVIGYDINSDICIGIYDDTLEYNKNFFPEELYNIRNNLKTLKIYDNLELKLGQEIINIGNPSLIDNDSFLSGKIMDKNYYGSFEKISILSNPPTILTNIHISEGQSGSPLFIRDIDNILKCVSILNAKLGDDLQFSMGIKGQLFQKIISNCINKWFELIKKYGINDIENINFFIQDIYQKKWLGVSFIYYHYSEAIDMNPAFTNLAVNGGVIITNFILGFNTISRKFIYNYSELSQQGVIKIDTPLLKSKMYNKFILNDKIPILLKSIKLYDRLKGEYNTFNLGKYKEQYSMDLITYGFQESSSVMNDTKYANSILNSYNSIELSYFYYNGKEWLQETEIIGGNDASWYSEYTDNYGHIFLQHKFELPQILVPYLTYFANNIF